MCFFFSLFVSLTLQVKGDTMAPIRRRILIYWGKWINQWISIAFGSNCFFCLTHCIDNMHAYAELATKSHKSKCKRTTSYGSKSQMQKKSDELRSIYEWWKRPRDGQIKSATNQLHVYFNLATDILKMATFSLNWRSGYRERDLVTGRCFLSYRCTAHTCHKHISSIRRCVAIRCHRTSEHEWNGMNYEVEMRAHCAHVRH